MHTLTSHRQRDIYTVVDEQWDVVLATFGVKCFGCADEKASITSFVSILDNCDTWIGMSM